MIQVQKRCFGHWLTRGKFPTLRLARDFAAQCLLTEPGHGARIQYVMPDGRILSFYDVVKGAT